MTRIYLIRHGETDLNRKGCYYGWTDCSLSENGVMQAKALAKAFQSIKLDAVLSSDLERAMATARIIGQGTEPLPDKRLRELNFGKWEGKNYKEVMAEYQDCWQHWIADPLSARPTEGESSAEMYNRICSFVDEAVKKYINGDIAIIGHNGSLRMIVTYLLGLTLDKQWCFSFEHGRYSLLELNEGHCTINTMNSI